MGMTNIINLKDHRPGAKTDTAIHAASAIKTQSGLGVAPEATEVALESRINARRAELIAKLIELRSSMHLEAAEAGDKIKARLSELAHVMREGVVDGWTTLGDSVKHKLDRWLADSASHLTVTGPVTVTVTAPANSEQS
jgi:hypothetical protein